MCTKLRVSVSEMLFNWIGSWIGLHVPLKLWTVLGFSVPLQGRTGFWIFFHPCNEGTQTKLMHHATSIIHWNRPFFYPIWTGHAVKSSHVSVSDISHQSSSAVWRARTIKLTHWSVLLAAVTVHVAARKGKMERTSASGHGYDNESQLNCVILL